MTTDINSRLGAAIRRKRILLGLSQEALGKQLLITFQQVQKYENGKNQLSVARLIEMANALKVSPLDLLATALDETPVRKSGTSDRATLEMVKRLERLEPNQRRAVRLLVQHLAGEAA